MLPQTISTLVAFLVLVVPGALFEFFRRSARPSQNRSTFEEIAVFVLASLAFGAVGVGGAALARLLRPRWFPDPGRWIADQHTYLADHHGAVLAGLTVYLMASLAFVVMLVRSLNRPDHAGVAGKATRLLHAALRLPTSRIVPTPPWYTMLRGALLPADADRVVSVHLDDGRTITGTLRAYTADGTIAHGDLILDLPVTVTFPDRPPTELEGEPWRLYCVAADHIVDLAVGYRAKPARR